MEKRNKQFGRLLRAGLNSIGTIEGKNVELVDDEIGAEVGLAGVSLQRYRTGALPSDHNLTAALARACVRRGMMGQQWLAQFLQAARFPMYEGRALQAQLFPAAPAEHTPTPRPNLPAPRPFVMRRAAYDATLEGLRSALPLTAIVSLGGMGKTSLATTVARHCLEQQVEPHFAVAVWVSDKDHPGTTSLSSLLDDIARVLDYPGLMAHPFAEKRQQVEHLLRSQPVLLVVDNAETINDRALLDWLARLPAPSKALLTSRDAPPTHTPAVLVELAPMDTAESRDLIRSHLQYNQALRMPGALEQLLPIAEVVGGNPKAIELALGLVQRRPRDEVLAELRAARNDQLFDELFARAWSLLDAPAASTLLALTLFPDSAAEAGLAFTVDQPVTAFQRSVEQLASLSLLDVERSDLLSPPRYALHPLVRAFAAARLAERPAETTALRERWLRWCRDLAGAVGFCWDDLDRLAILDLEHETVQVALEWASENGRDQATLDLAEGLRYFYNVRGLWDERRLENYQRRADAARRLTNTSELVLALAQHAEILSKQATLPAAAELLAAAETAAAGAELNDDAAFELGHARGLLAHARGDLAAAEAAWRALLPFAARLGGQKYVINRRWLATCLREQGRMAEALPLYREALADAEIINDTRSVTGNSLKLAAIDLDRGDLDAAAAALERCADVAGRYQDRRRLAECQRLTARLLKARGECSAAREALEQAADLFARMGMQREARAARSELEQPEAENKE